MAETKSNPFKELGIEFVVEILLFLLPYGAEQMELPHNFWLGALCWLAGIAIGIRMFWIFPLWSRHFTPLAKGVIAFVFIALFVSYFYQPVIVAYKKHTAAPPAPVAVLSPEVLLIYRDKKIEIHNPGPHTLYLYSGAYGDIKIKLENDPPRVIVPGAYYYLFAEELESGMRSHLRDNQTGRDTFHAFVTTEDAKKYTLRGLLMGTMSNGALTIHTQILPTIPGWSDDPI